MRVGSSHSLPAIVLRGQADVLKLFQTVCDRGRSQGGIDYAAVQITLRCNARLPLDQGERKAFVGAAKMAVHAELACFRLGSPAL